MKILMVIPYLASVYGGPTKVVKELSYSLGQLGISVDLITTDADGAQKLETPLQTWIDERYYRIQYFSCLHRNDLIFSLPLLIWLLKNIHAYDVVHTHNRFAPLTLLTEGICQLRQVPYITTCHGMLEPWALSYKAWKKRLYFSLLERPALQNARVLHALTTAEASNIHLLKIPTPTTVIPNGIHCHEFAALPDPAVFYQQFPELRGKSLILFLGRIDPKKGLDLLALAFARVQAQFPETHLVIAGPDSIGFLPLARKFFATAGCQEAVTFVGMLSGSLKQAALAAASMYVAPYYSEGFSMSVLEGMATGLPCVITTGCNFPEAATAGVAQVVDIQANAIADALLQLLQSPADARAMGDRARNYVFQNYTWHEIARKFEQVYAAIAAQKPLYRYRQID
ncbi:MAG: glycosyltransferase [Kovacikia sp.]